MTYASKIDLTSLYILRKLGLLEEFVPLSSSPDGSCLFNAASLLIYGTEDRKTELRFRTLQYLIRNFVTMNSRGSYLKDPASVCSPNMLDTVKKASNTSGWSSHLTIMALSNVIGAPISVLYPAVRPTKQSELLTKKYYPKEQSYRDTLNLMWTNLTTDDFACLRDCNHFVPLVPKSEIYKTHSGKGPHAEELFVMSSKTPVEQINDLIQKYAQDVLDARELWDKQMQNRNSIRIQETSSSNDASDEISYSVTVHENLVNSETITAEKRKLAEDDEIISLSRPKITKGNEPFFE